MSLEGKIYMKRKEFSLEGEFKFPANSVVAVLGRSGCGKTTFLRCLAGLEPELEGELSFGGEKWLEKNNEPLPLHLRRIGYMSQQASLFPHLNVKDNLEYGLKRNPGKGSLKKTAELLGITHLLEKSVRTLSGGEAQRVSLGRTLLSHPQLLLLDEPLNALDETSKQELLGYLKTVFKELDIPVVYISHSLYEAAILADYLMVIEGGRLGPIESFSELEDNNYFQKNYQLLKNSWNILETKIKN